MKLKSATFKCLKPIYRSSGKKEIYIDFTKCKHNIILILGKNGSGKSTIINALQPLPESPSLYIDGEAGQKVIEYFFEDLIYRVKIDYPINGLLQRGNTKAYLTKIMPDNTEIELNPNGNIGSYKDALYSEFKLDPNFISLTQLSMEDRGIVERIPSDRKKYVNSMLEEVQVYNDIHKSLNKRSSIFRSMMNNITAKIDMIGDKDILTHQLESLNKNISSVEETIERSNMVISSNTAMINMIDPNGEIQNTYNKLCSELLRIEDHIKDIEVLLSKYKSKYENLENILSEIEDKKSKLQKFNLELSSAKEKLNDYLVSREEEYKIFQMKKQKLDAMKSDFVANDLKETILKLRKNIEKYQSIFDEIGIDGLSITKNEYIIGLNTLKDIKESITTMRSYATQSDIELAVKYYLENFNIIDEKKKIETEICLLNKDLEDYQQKISYYKGILSTSDILEKRPETCNIDTCPFIINALEASKLEPKKNIDLLEQKIEQTNSILNKKNKELENVETTMQTYQMLHSIIRSINNNSSIIQKLPNGELFIDINKFLNALVNGSNFNEINVLYSYIQYSNIFELYKNEKEQLMKLEYEYKLHENKISMIEEIDNELRQLQVKLDHITEIISDYQNKITDSNSSIMKTENELQTLNRLKEMYQEKEEYANQEKIIQQEIDKITINMQKIKENLTMLNQANQTLIKAKSDIKPLQEDRDKIKFNLTKLDEYYKELEEFNGKYSMIELIKKYSSPTKGGIQTLFMKLYMSKTLELTNELLSYLFQGELELLPYVINETEFRIPCKNINSSVINDDISSCSSAEKSMISMILSFALLKQSSTKYNILKMDEMDGPLDQYNRTHFLTVLNIIMDKLEVENCLMVSHSSEIDMSNVDIILLSDNNSYGYDDNIIFSF